MRRILLVFALTSLIALTLSHGFASPPSPVVSANSIQRWSVSNGHFALNFFGDGTLLASKSGVVLGPHVPGGNGVEAVKLDPETGDVIENIYSPDVRTTIRLGSDSQHDWIMGGYENWSAFAKDGTFIKLLFPTGCCNVPRYPFAFDHINDRAFIAASSGIGYVDLNTDDRPGLGITGNFFGMVSLADETTAYTAGQQGIVAKTNTSTGYVWQTSAIDTRLQPGAVAADGSFIVTSGFAHFEGSIQPGRLALVTPSGVVAWNNFVNAVTPPVIGGNGLIFIGAQPAPINENGPGTIEAYDPATGSLVWSVPVDGLPNDLLVGDDGAVYAGTGGYGNGRIYSIGQDDGTLRQIITDVTAAWEIILRAGLLYASGQQQFTQAATITALPVAANNYDLNSPWPVRYHDNQRTSNRTHPILTPDRIPADGTAPTSEAGQAPVANLAGWNNTDVSVQLSAQDNDGGSGVESISYSASGTQIIGLTTIIGSSATLSLTGEGVTTVSYFATDADGNVEEAKTLTVRIDRSAPTIQLTSPTAGSYLLNQSVTAQFECSDTVSGLGSCIGTVGSGSAINTASPGTFTFSVDATDIAGNTSQESVTYSVRYGVQVLYDQTKAHKSGSTIPIKIRLVDANGNTLSSPTTVVHAVGAVQVSSQASATLEDSGNSNPDFDFRYDGSLSGYVFNLKTTGYGTGSYLLNFVVGNDPDVYSVGFQVRQ